jgi:hypothetical protein
MAVGPTSELCPEDAELFSMYSSKLAEQGLLVSAAKYSTPDSYEGKVLRDRLYRSKASPSCLAAMGGIAPEFPFTMTNVKMSRAEPAKTTRNTRQMRTQASTTSNYSQYSQSSGVSNSYASQTSQQRSATPTPSTAQPVSHLLCRYIGEMVSHYCDPRLWLEHYQMDGLNFKTLQAV